MAGVLPTLISSALQPLSWAGSAFKEVARIGGDAVGQAARLIGSPFAEPTPSAAPVPAPPPVSHEALMQFADKAVAAAGVRSDKAPAGHSLHADPEVSRMVANLQVARNLRTGLQRAATNRPAFPDMARDLLNKLGPAVADDDHRQLLMIGMTLQFADALGLYKETVAALAQCCAASPTSMAPSSGMNGIGPMQEAMRQYRAQMSRMGWAGPTEPEIDIDPRFERAGIALLVRFPGWAEGDPKPRIPPAANGDSDSD